MVVVAIMALLTAILAPSIQQAIKAAKLSICGHNVRQILLGAGQYAANNEGNLPPSVVRWCWTSHGYSWPDELNYHADDPRADTKYNGGAVYPYLGRYLPDVSVFVCSFSPGEPEYMQREYEAGNTRHLGSSYWLLWDYRGFESGFQGPTTLHSSGQDDLLVSDMLAWRGYSNDWWQAHSSPGVVGSTGEFFYGYGSTWIRFAGSEAVPRDMRMNAGYTDGHVEQYTADEMGVSKHVASGYPHQFYIPDKVR